ncbi:MAG: Transcriptional regulator, TetR family [uncultured Sulfurovum sp.]|uniref:Transcriptional regulator, TetR family n=1 Tax=uncultured Sulfurovum sp. TaxID=269237 RepID=A0A6S6TRM8_9BACT|nr:MAG: Transcriptional regulator, TetR family [uncultured Sulfurovum sp.]
MVSIKKGNTREKILDSMYKNVYIQGYERTGVALLLTECGIAKGALYHHFKSKKEIMLCTLKERLSPAMNLLFDDSQKVDYNIILETLEEISNSKELILNNCPYNKFNMELYMLDDDFKEELDRIFKVLTERLQRHLDAGVENKMIKEIDTASLAEFIYANIWGALSLSRTKKAFDSKIQHLLNYLETINLK